MQIKIIANIVQELLMDKTDYKYIPTMKYNLEIKRSKLPAHVIVFSSVQLLSHVQLFATQ